MQAFANILAVYGEDRAIREAAVHYARVEYHPVNPESLEAAEHALPGLTTETLRAYIDRVPEEAVTTGKGLYLHSADARTLSHAVQFLVRSFERARVPVCHLRADRPVTPTDRRFALAAPILIIERIDFLRVPTPDLLRDRATLARPLIVTSMQPASEVPDSHLRRIFLSRTRLIDLDSHPSLPTHGSVPAESEHD
jgi:hypothetical protein